MAKANPSTQLTPEEWGKAKDIYISSTIGLRQLSKDFKTTYHRVVKRYQKENWKQLRKEYFENKRSTIAEESLERSLEKALTKDSDHQMIAGGAVLLARNALAILATQMRNYRNNKKGGSFNPLAIQRVISALKEAVNLERVTYNLPTGVTKSDVTSGGKPLGAAVDSFFEDKEIMKLAKELKIDVKYFKGLVARVNDDSRNQGQS